MSPAPQRRAGASQPMWRRTYNAAERRLSGPLADAIHSDAFADAVGIVTRSRSLALRLIERNTRRYWHRLTCRPAAI